MRKVLLAVAMLATGLFQSSTASAAITMHFDLVTNPGQFTGPGATVFNNVGTQPAWRGYQVRLVSNATGNPAWDRITTADIMFEGPMHQRWISSNADGIYDTPSVIHSSITNVDSHFLITSNMFGATIGTPSETNLLTGSPIANTDIAGYGVGGGPAIDLWGNFGILPAFQSTSINVAYLVLQDFTTVTLSGLATAGQTGGDVFTLSGSVVAIPEPASLSLLGLAALALMRSRKPMNA